MSKFDLDASELKKFIEDFGDMIDDLPYKIGNEMVNFSKDKFTSKEWKGVPWKNSINNTNTLIKSGDLRDSIHVSYADKKRVVVESDSEYAEIHNEGGTISVTSQMQKFFWAKYNKTKKDFWKSMALKKVGSKITIDERKFMGDDDPKLLEQINKMIIEEIKKIK